MQGNKMKDIKVPKLNKFAKLCYTEAEDRGFHSTGRIADPKSPAIVPMVANLFSEVAELYEAWREGRLDKPCDKAEAMEKAGLPVLTCAEEECADIFVRLLDDTETLGIDLERAVKIKMEYNRTRSYRHGNKLA